MFLGKKNQYCENEYTTKHNQYIQCDPYQITNSIFHRSRTKNFTIHLETKQTLNSQSNLEKEKWSWRNKPSWFQIILQCYSHQDSMVLAQKQKHRPMEQDRKPKNKPMHLSVQFSSVTESCLTLCDPMNSSTPGLPVHQQLPEFTQSRVHRVSDAIQPSHPLLPPSPSFNLFQGLFQWVSSSHQVAKILEF